jgi:hypothetical protein
MGRPRLENRLDAIASGDDLLPRFHLNPSDGSCGRMAVTEISHATLLDELAAPIPAQRREVAAWRDTATSPPLTPGH